MEQASPCCGIASQQSSPTIIHIAQSTTTTAKPLSIWREVVYSKTSTMNALVRRSDDDVDDSRDSSHENLRPLVPDFDDQEYCLTEDMYDDWLCVLAAENFQRISDATEWDYSFLTTQAVEYIFTICVRLRLPQEVKYLAVFIFNDFMMVHVDALYKIVQESTEPNERKQYEWERVETNLSRQTTLRILSAIQIASKLHSYHDSLSNKMVRLCSKTLGYAYTEESVLRSEIRIAGSLDWKISSRQTPVIYAETLLKILEKRSTRRFNTATYWQFTLLCMDCVLMFWDDILRMMLVNVLGCAGYNFPRSHLCRVRADWMLLGAGVIAAAASCADSIAVADWVIEELHQICGIPNEDVTDMCVAIVQFIVEKQNNLSCSSNSSNDYNLEENDEDQTVKIIIK